MKKLIFFSVALLAITACQKDPDMGKLENDYSVYTTYDPTKFTPAKAYHTKVFVPTAITVLNQSGTEPTSWSTGNAQSIITAFRTGLTSYGYDVNGVEGTDLELKLTYVRNVTYYYDYYPDYWWWDYWDGGYWPYWYYPYPYAYVYEFSMASLSAELVTPGASGLSQGSTLPVQWNVFIGGYDYGSQETNGGYIAARVPQAFTQSPYLKTANAPQ